MTTSTPILETARTRLEAVRIEDAADIFAYASNPNVLRYTTGTPPARLEETAGFVRGLVKGPDDAFAWSIRRKGSPSVIGLIQFTLRGDNARGSVDFALAEEYWNQGIMTEVVLAVIDWAFRALPGLQTIISAAMTANPASTRVQEKCGMRVVRYETRKWDKFEDPVETAYAEITRAEWGKERP